MELNEKDREKREWTGAWTTRKREGSTKKNPRVTGINSASLYGIQSFEGGWWMDVGENANPGTQAGWSGCAEEERNSLERGTSTEALAGTLLWS